MARRFPSILFAILAGTLSAGNADARNRSAQDSNLLTPIMDASPTLAPFQHVRFCLRYPSDCKSNPAENDHIDLDAETSELLKHVNHSVNLSIIPTIKDYGTNLGDGWTIAPDMGDCNDYAVTKRHRLTADGWPARDVLLSEVVTVSGEHHLVVVVRTSDGDLVLDNLTDRIMPWFHKSYRWVRIQMPENPNYWASVRKQDA